MRETLYTQQLFFNRNSQALFAVAPVMVNQHVVRQRSKPGDEGQVVHPKAPELAEYTQEYLLRHVPCIAVPAGKAVAQPIDMTRIALYKSFPGGLVSALAIPDKARVLLPRFRECAEWPDRTHGKGSTSHVVSTAVLRYEPPLCFMRPSNRSTDRSAW